MFRQRQIDTTLREHSLSVKAIHLWNDLDDDYKQIANARLFKRRITDLTINSYSHDS